MNWSRGWGFKAKLFQFAQPRFTVAIDPPQLTANNASSPLNGRIGRPFQVGETFTQRAPRSSSALKQRPGPRGIQLDLISAPDSACSNIWFTWAAISSRVTEWRRGFLRAALNARLTSCSCSLWIISLEWNSEKGPRRPQPAREAAMRASISCLHSACAFSMPSL